MAMIFSGPGQIHKPWTTVKAEKIHGLILSPGIGLGPSAGSTLGYRTHQDSANSSYFSTNQPYFNTKQPY
jgi:hypothetical protein